MNNFQKMGGIAALIEAATFVVGLALFLTLLASANYGSLEIDPIRHVAFLANNQSILQSWYLIIYMVFGVGLVVHALALYERLKADAPVLAQLATAFGLIWAGLVIATGMVAIIGIDVVVDLYGKDPTRAASTWLALHFVLDGLGGGIEFPGGVWVLLISWGALRTGTLPKTLNYLGVVTGVAGILTAVAAFTEVVAIFGVGIIVWFMWVGIVMVRRSPNVEAFRQITTLST